MTTAPAEQKQSIVEYETEHGKIKLSPSIIKKYLVSGDASKVSEQEVMMFLSLCKYQRLNPFLREAYLIKFGQEPATIVTGKETFTKRAAASEICKGWEAGIVVVGTDDEIKKREGTLKLPQETLIGGWARIHRGDWNVPFENTVSLEEYQRRKKDGTLMANWKNMPATMIRKVALVQALREAFPENFQGMYSPEEMPVEDKNLEQAPIEPPKDEPPKEEKPQKNSKNTPKNITKEQKNKINTLFEEKQMDTDELKELVSEALGKQVESINNLTYEEANTVITALESYERKEETETETEDNFVTEDQTAKVTELCGVLQWGSDALHDFIENETRFGGITFPDDFTYEAADELIEKIEEQVEQIE